MSCYRSNRFTTCPQTEPLLCEESVTCIQSPCHLQPEGACGHLLGGAGNDGYSDSSRPPLEVLEGLALEREGEWVGLRGASGGKAADSNRDLVADCHPARLARTVRITIDLTWPILNADTCTPSVQAVGQRAGGGHGQHARGPGRAAQGGALDTKLGAVLEVAKRKLKCLSTRPFKVD